MENYILSTNFLIIISILYCVLGLYLMHVSSVQNVLITSILYFVIAFYLTCISYSQETKEVEINQNKSILETKIDKPVLENGLIPKVEKPVKDQNNALITELSTNVLFLKTYLKTHYEKVPDEIEDIIAKAVNDLSHKHCIDFNLVVGIIGVESSFNPYATSKVGARGLMQVMYGVWKDHLKISDVMDLHNIHEGIEYGILAFLQCRKEAKGNLVKALQKYSGTKGQVYVNKINKEIDRFMELKESKTI